MLGRSIWPLCFRFDTTLRLGFGLKLRLGFGLRFGLGLGFGLGLRHGPPAASAGRCDDDVAVRVLALGAGHDTFHFVDGVMNSLAISRRHCLEGLLLA